MYFPLLRGRQFELIALREFAIERGDKNNVIPIIEPVKKSFNSIRTAINRLTEAEVNFAIILNPKVGDLKDDSDIVFNELELDLLDFSKWIPTFYVADNYSEINDQISDLSLNDVMLILTDLCDSNSTGFEQLVLSSNVKYVVSKENRSLKRLLNGEGKFLVRLDDNFKGQKRNKDYLNIPEEKFTEEHMFYNDDGYNGFSDYTLLESGFSEGGSTPRAVSIHLSYSKQNNEIWIKHFTSISNTGISNVQGKFAEAAEKAVNFINTADINHYATNELKHYFEEAKYPGLGMVKKISLKNHLELINDLIENQK